VQNAERKKKNFGNPLKIFNIKTRGKTMEIKPKKIINNFYLVNRLKKILFLQTAFLLPLILLALILQFFPFMNRIFKLSVNVPLYIVTAAAILFTPFLLFVLIKEKYYSWIIFYFFMVVLPYIFIPLAFFGHILFPAILFYIYCYFLKHTVTEWLEEYDAHLGREEQKRKSEQRKKDEMRWN
jgi:cellulose synthase/poly-beta-1,6-N-acetylglucosamine synthase-like glycosyltransferase